MARSFPEIKYDSLVDEAAILALIADDIEHLFLDFKEVRNALDGEMLGKALSGFANTEGGLLVLGVDDKTRTPRPVADARALAERVNELASRMVSPIVPGVVCRPVPASNGGGFVVVLIPQSDVTPHMAIGHDRYYQRSGDSFTPMRHHAVADLFGRRPHPVLELRAVVHRRSRGVWLHLVLHNHGKGIARFPFVHLQQVEETRLDHNPQEGGLRLLSGRQGYAFGGGANDVLHSGSSVTVATIDERPDAQGEPLLIRAIIAAEGAPSIEVEVLLDAGQLKQRINAESRFELLAVRRSGASHSDS